MSAHTPGPWQVVDEVAFEVRACGEQMLVADLRGCGYLTGSGGLALSVEHAEKIQRANAHLISAAPDMFAALKGLLAAREGEAGFRAAFVNAQAAIARAEGKS